MFFSGRKHNTDDIIATVLAVEPMRFIYRGRIAVFSIKVRSFLTLNYKTNKSNHIKGVAG